MQAIQIEDYFAIGTILKPHGLAGEMVVEVEEGLEDLLESASYLMVEVEGGLVPFFVREDGIRFRSSTSLCVAFDDLDSAVKVRNFCGCKIYLHKDDEQAPGEETEFSSLLGATVFDLERGELGPVIRVDNFSGNVVLTVPYLGHEILIPMSEELITTYDEEGRELHLDCPEGLIELYLE